MFQPITHTHRSNKIPRTHQNYTKQLTTLIQETNTSDTQQNPQPTQLFKT